MAFEGLTAQITAEAVDYNATIDRAKDRAEELADEANEVSLAMTIMQGRMDEAADEARDLAVSSFFASSALQSTSGAATTTNFSLLGLSTTLTGSVIPGIILAAGVLAVLTAAIATVGAAVLSLVGTFGLLIGAGVVTHLEDLKDAFQDVIPRIKRAIEPLGRVFGPVLEDAIRALPQLTRNIVQAIGGVGQFARALRQFGGIAMQIIPAAVGAMADFARLALPALRKVTSFLAGQGGSIFAAIRKTFNRIGDELGAFFASVVKILPAIIRFGGILIELFLPVLTSLVQVLDFAIGLFNGLYNAIQPILPLVKALIPVLVAGLAVVLGGPLTAAVGILVAAVTILRAVWNSLDSDMQEWLSSTAQDVIRALALIGRLAMFAARAVAGFSSAFATSPAQRATAVAGLMRASQGGINPGEIRAEQRRNRARRGNPGAREGGPPVLEITGDTGVVEDVAYRAGEEGGQRAVRDVSRQKRRQGQRSDRR